MCRETVSFIEEFHNRQMLHQSLGHLTPLNLERRISASYPGVRKSLGRSSRSLSFPFRGFGLHPANQRIPMRSGAPKYWRPFMRRMA